MNSPSTVSSPASPASPPERAPAGLGLAIGRTLRSRRPRSRRRPTSPCRPPGTRRSTRARASRRGPACPALIGVDVGALERLAQRRDLRLDRRPVLGRHLVAEVLDRPLGLVGQLLRLVAELDLLASLLVLIGVALGVADHLVDVVLGQHRRGGDPDLLLLGGRPVLGLDVEDAVGVDVERHLDLRDAARRRRDPVEDEPAEGLVVGREVALALEDVDLDLALVVRGRREHLRLRGRDGRVAVDQPGHDAAQGLDAQGQRRDVEQEDVLDLAAEHARLDRGADRHDLVGVDALVGLLAAEQRLDHLLDGRHARLAADEDDLVDLRPA